MQVTLLCARKNSAAYPAVRPHAPPPPNALHVAGDAVLPGLAAAGLYVPLGPGALAILHQHLPLVVRMTTQS